MPDDSDWTAPGGAPGDPAPPESWPQAGAPAPPPGWGQPAAPPQWGQPAPPAWGQPPAPQWGSPQPPAWQQQPGQQWSQPAGWAGAPDAPRPGVIPLRPLGVGELLDGAITTIRRYPRATLGVSAVVATLLQAASFIITRPLPETYSDGSTSGIRFNFLGPWLFISILFGVFLSGAMAVVVGSAVLGRPISLGEVWSAVRARFWALLGVSALVSLFTSISVFVCLLPALFVWPVLSLAAPALMLERQPVWAAVRRSQALVKGEHWRCLGILALTLVIRGFVGAALTLPFLLATGNLGSILSGSANANADLSSLDMIVIGVGGIIAGTIVLPFSASVSALLYVDRRMRSEGLDVTFAAAAAAGQAQPPVPPRPA